MKLTVAWLLKSAGWSEWCALKHGLLFEATACPHHSAVAGLVVISAAPTGHACFIRLGDGTVVRDACVSLQLTGGIADR